MIHESLYFALKFILLSELNLSISLRKVIHDLNLTRALHSAIITTTGRRGHGRGPGCGEDDGVAGDAEFRPQREGQDLSRGAVRTQIGQRFAGEGLGVHVVHLQS